MALFGKKKQAEYCAICGKERKGGFLRGLFQASVEGQYVCSDCYGDVDLPGGAVGRMTMQEFKAYVDFREKNKMLKARFNPTCTIDLGVLDSKIVFDSVNGYLCFDKNLNKTIFERGQLRSFVIREDDNAIFSGSEAGFESFESNVPSRIHMMQPEFMRFRREMRMFQERLNRMSAEEREQQEKNAPRFNETEPFRNFYIELYFDHPYWNEMTLDMNGPRFDDKDASAEVYLSSYRCRYSTMEELAHELMKFGFRSVGISGASEPVSQVDAADALLRFKELRDMGVLTEEEFAAKKRQLLGL